MSLEHSPARGRRILRSRDLLEIFGISNSTLWAWVKSGALPKPIDLGPNSRAWLADEIDALIEERARERDQDTAHGHERWIDCEKSLARLRGERPARGRK